MTLKNCKICNKEYEGHFNSYFCSPECKHQGKLNVNKKYTKKISDQKTKIFEDAHQGEWVDIKGYEGLYMINKKGEVKSSVRQGGGNILLKKHLGKHGYYTYGLRRKNEKHITHPIHRLLGLHFIDNPNNLPCIDHIDRNRTNNNLDNLRWVTQKTNCRNSERVINKKGGIHIDKRTIKGKEYIYYRVTWTDKEFKRLSKRFKTREEAEKFKSELYI